MDMELESSCFGMEGSTMEGGLMKILGRATLMSICTGAYYSIIAPFYHIRAKERTKYATLLHCRTGQKYGLKEVRQNCRTKLIF